jgi:hypothetical protein
LEPPAVCTTTFVVVVAPASAKRADATVAVAAVAVAAVAVAAVTPAFWGNWAAAENVMEIVAANVVASVPKY